jgi:hypothetical protein
MLRTVAPPRGTATATVVGTSRPGSDLERGQGHGSPRGRARMAFVREMEE